VDTAVELASGGPNQVHRRDMSSSAVPLEDLPSSAKLLEIRDHRVLLPYSDLFEETAQPMKSLIRNRSLLRGLALGVCLLGWAAPAHADYIYNVFDDGVAVGQVAVSGDAFSTGTLTTTHFKLVIGSSTTNPTATSTTVSSQLNATLTASGSHTLK